MKKALLAAVIFLSLGSSAVAFADGGRDWYRYRHHGYTYRGDYGRSHRHHWSYRHRPYFHHSYRQPYRFYHHRHYGHDYRRHWYR